LRHLFIVRLGDGRTLRIQAAGEDFGALGEILGADEVGLAGFLGLLDEGFHLGKEILGGALGLAAFGAINIEARFLEVSADALVALVAFALAEDWR
jgi:hypothetical protein